MAKAKAAKPNEAAGTEAPAESPPECFVVMPISDPEGYEKDHFLRVYEDIFKPACVEAGFQPIRGDEVNESNMIHLDIIRRLYDSPMVLCDLSGKNPNVMFELGFRQAFDKPAVLVQEKGQGRIFDTSGLRAQDYDRSLSYRSVVEDRKRITAALKATRDADPKQNVNSLIRLLAMRNVKFTAAGEIEAADANDILAMVPRLMGDVAEILEAVRAKGGVPPRERITAIPRAEIRWVSEELDKAECLLEVDPEQAFDLADDAHEAAVELVQADWARDHGALLFELVTRAASLVGEAGRRSRRKGKTGGS